MLCCESCHDVFDRKPSFFLIEGLEKVQKQIFFVPKFSSKCFSRYLEFTDDKPAKKTSAGRKVVAQFRNLKKRCVFEKNLFTPNVRLDWKNVDCSTL